MSAQKASCRGGILTEAAYATGWNLGLDVADRDVVNVSGTEAIKVPFDDIKICPTYLPAVSGVVMPPTHTGGAQLMASSEVPRRKRLENTKAAARAK